MIQSLLHIFVSLYVAVLVPIPQIKIRTFVRFHVVSQLPVVIEKPTLRIERETAHFHRLLVQRKVSLIKLLPCAQTLGAERVLCWCRPRRTLVSGSEMCTVTVVSSAIVSFLSVC